MKISLALFTVALLVGFNSVARAQDMTLETAPPVVVKTVPEAGAKDVDPGLTEIKVTFSKDMHDHSWSCSTAWEKSTPESPAGPKYSNDKRTCVLPVKLEPGKVYGFWLNSEKFHNFKDADGRPAVPYLLIFRTKAATSAQNQSAVQYPVGLSDRRKAPPTFSEPLSK
jgi:RNA polymerase sigma-70 factor (ECF subfamily)